MSEMKKEKNQTTQHLIITVAAVLFFFSLFQLDVISETFLASFDGLLGITSTMFPPTIDEPIDIFGAAVESLQVAIMGTVFGILFSIFLAAFAARNLAPHWSISYAVKAFAAFVRAVPALIWALLFIVAVGLGPTPGILALAVNSIGMLVKIYAESIEEIDESVLDAVKATGASKFQVIMQGVVPMLLSTFISWSVFRFDINIRYAAVLGVVGAGGIGWELVRASRMLAYDQMLAITLVIFGMILAVEMLTRFMKGRAIQVNAKASS
ncbi:phosphonate ABC transporter, permease protein PhnE [Salicibibacter kimchii]|uniref:Phosphonate ABC transporter, permease protein PhnE n=1 Tax=Salicibibacter kimchii TaxID=2099786 RepID=A0A345BY70_9BACI|nr:phosphonate ABC transporter, permease protein PhnE [Salicibibacter kimchii]AXF55901.1 phosphonate ABC transporter, permease protein PhnE [Salicibibacter kimchii]